MAKTSTADADALESPTSGEMATSAWASAIKLKKLLRAVFFADRGAIDMAKALLLTATTLDPLAEPAPPITGIFPSVSAEPTIIFVNEGAGIEECGKTSGEVLPGAELLFVPSSDELPPLPLSLGGVAVAPEAPFVNGLEAPWPGKKPP